MSWSWHVEPSEKPISLKVAWQIQLRWALRLQPSCILVHLMPHGHLNKCRGGETGGRPRLICKFTGAILQKSDHEINWLESISWLTSAGACVDVPNITSLGQGRDSSQGSVERKSSRCFFKCINHNIQPWDTVVWPAWKILCIQTDSNTSNKQQANDA